MLLEEDIQLRINMFTGIIQEVGKIINIQLQEKKKYFIIACKLLQDDLQIGESIACNGICMTVIDFDNASIKVEAMNQTLQTTTANIWKHNDLLHLEKALSFAGRLNGHIVQGHIDTISKVIRRFKINNTLYLEFFLDSKFNQLMVEHGSIAIDGVSLTVAVLDKSLNAFQVALIGHTLSITNLVNLTVGSMVNLEFDIIGKYVLNLNNKKNITEKWLIDNGF
ncbi:MAG: riboflavin synthase [Candidatus Cloacimonetes bacterium]|jgi:riboflavin synthase|nr:riboflavin synthase [Candidatus Cloacimonadota bacterium]